MELVSFELFCEIKQGNGKRFCRSCTYNLEGRLSHKASASTKTLVLGDLIVIMVCGFNILYYGLARRSLKYCEKSFFYLLSELFSRVR